MDASLEKDKNGVLYLLYRKNENSRPVRVELSSLLDIKNSSETLGNHLRNLLSPYQQTIDVLDHICDENETDETKVKLLTLLYKQLGSKKANLQELIEFSKSPVMESNYWRI